MGGRSHYACVCLLVAKGQPEGIQCVCHDWPLHDHRQQSAATAECTGSPFSRIHTSSPTQCHSQPHTDPTITVSVFVCVCDSQNSVAINRLHNHPLATCTAKWLESWRCYSLRTNITQKGVLLYWISSQVWCGHRHKAANTNSSQTDQTDCY